MAIYDNGPNSFLLARPEDLVLLRVDVDPEQQTVSLTFPTQHVMEYPLPLTGPGPTQDVPDPPPWNATMPGVGSTVPSVGGGGQWNVIQYPLRGGFDVDHLLEQLDGAVSSFSGLQFPTLMYLEAFGQARWALRPAPRMSTDGWTAVWQADLLATDRMLAGTSGPLLHVKNTQDSGFEGFGFRVRPMTDYPLFRDAVFEAAMSMSMLGATGRINGPFWADLQPHPEAPAFRYAARFGRETGSHEVIHGFLSSGHRAQLDVDTVRVFSQMVFDGIGLGGTAADPYVNGQTYLAAHLHRTATLTVLETEVAVQADSPFRRLRLADATTTRTQAPADQAFWLTNNGADLQFALVGTDWEGVEHAFAAPLMFRTQAATPDAVQAAFTSGPDTRRQVHLGGSRVALADRAGRADLTADAVTLPVHQVVLGLVADAERLAVMAPRQVQVVLDAVGRLTDKASTAVCDLLHRVDQAGNFLTIPGGLPVVFPAPAVGGLASPDSVLGAVNAVKGAIPTLDPAQAFADARMLGVSLVDLLGDVQDELPQLDSVQLPDSVVTTYHWTPKLDTDADGVVRFEDGSSLTLTATLTQSLDPEQVVGAPRPPTTDVTGTLTKVTLSLLDVITVRFEKVEFLTKPHAAPTVTATGVTVAFDKDLRFIQDLAEQIADFADGCPITVDSSGITAGYTLSVPDFGFGVFSLSNVSLGADVRVPFTAEPTSVRFNFGERHSPFTVGVGIFGGGGFVALEATSRELKTVEASLEFGGDFAISVFVAQGHVFAMGGVSFLVLPDTVKLEGFLRCGGQLEVLDVVGVSVEFEVILGYVNDDRGERVYGGATVTVGVQLLVFHESVSFSVEKSFPIDDQPTPVSERLDESAWDQLCDAYA